MDCHAWLPRSKAAREASCNAASLDNQIVCHAGITLLKLSGLKLKGTRFNRDQEALSCPAKVVIWCEENEAEGSIDLQSNANSLPLFSCPMSIGNKRNDSSWSCVWPDEACTLVTPVMISKSGKCTITLYVGVHQEGQIQLLGYANVTSQMPGPKQDATAEDFHPLQEMEHIIVPVEALKKVTRLGIGFKKSRSEYSISPSAVLKLQLQMTFRMENVSSNVPSGLSGTNTSPCRFDESVDPDKYVISNKYVDGNNTTLLESVSEPVQQLKNEILSDGSMTTAVSSDGAHDDVPEGCILDSKRSLSDDSAAYQMVAISFGKGSQYLGTNFLDMEHNPGGDNTQPSSGDISIQKPDVPKGTGDNSGTEYLHLAENSHVGENSATDCQSDRSEIAPAEDYDLFVEVDLNKTDSGLSESGSLAVATKKQTISTSDINYSSRGASCKSSIIEFDNISDVSEASSVLYHNVSPKIKEHTPDDSNEPLMEKRPKNLSENGEWKMLEDMFEDVGGMVEGWLSLICCCYPKNGMFSDDATCGTSHTGCTGGTSLETYHQDLTVCTL